MPTRPCGVPSLRTGSHWDWLRRSLILSRPPTNPAVVAQHDGQLQQVVEECRLLLAEHVIHPRPVDRTSLTRLLLPDVRADGVAVVAELLRAWTAEKFAVACVQPFVRKLVQALLNINGLAVVAIVPGGALALFLRRPLLRAAAAAAAAVVAVCHSTRSSLSTRPR